jgi:hypothetical protein
MIHCALGRAIEKINGKLGLGQTLQAFPLKK